MKKILCLTIALGLSGFVVGCGEATTEKKTETKTTSTSPAGTTTKTEETKTEKH